MHFVTSTYLFFPVADVALLKDQLREAAALTNTLGLTILAPEGLNSTFSTVTADAREEWKKKLAEICDHSFEFKDSEAVRAPFRAFTVKLRDEIVSLGKPDVQPSPEAGRRLTPAQWHQEFAAADADSTVVIDVRNNYEFQLGTFPGALNPLTQKFSEFPDFLETQNIPRDRKILMFCTGGIRCEKASAEMRARGFNDIAQLDGGILKYLEEFPEGHFKGECLVFDGRVAVDPQLQPSQIYSWCPHCGMPGAEVIACERCGKEARICTECLPQDERRHSCSKDCRHQLARAQAQGKPRGSILHRK